MTLDDWARLLQTHGYEPGDALGSGMEGTVIALGDGLVAKLWHRRTPSEVARLAGFYDAVAEAGPPFRTPRVEKILELDGRVATVEPRLSGRPLWVATGESAELTDNDLGCVVDVLSGLARVTPTDAMRALPVLEGEAPFAGDFAAELAALVERRVERFREPLVRRLSDLEAIAETVVRRLYELEPATPTLIHGDLIPANILVDDSARPIAVIDFGFLTTVGDPAFDAAVTASIYDMYGSRAAEIEATLDAAIAARFGYGQERLALYRAAYALTTSNCFSASGGDGHFDWCVRMVERVRDKF